MADMSIAPLHIGAHLLDTAYAIGEKVNKLVLHDRVHAESSGSGVWLDHSRERAQLLIDSQVANTNPVYIVQLVYR